MTRCPLPIKTVVLYFLSCGLLGEPKSNELWIQNSPISSQKWILFMLPRRHWLANTRCSSNRKNTTSPSPLSRWTPRSSKFISSLQVTWWYIVIWKLQLGTRLPQIPLVNERATPMSHVLQIWRAPAMESARLSTSKGAMFSTAFTVRGHESVIQK